MGFAEEIPKIQVNWPALDRKFPGCAQWEQPSISTLYWDTAAWQLYFEGISKARKAPHCPGCARAAGPGPDGCCPKCWKGAPKPRQHMRFPDGWED